MYSGSGGEVSVEVTMCQGMGKLVTLPEAQVLQPG